MNLSMKYHVKTIVTFGFLIFIFLLLMNESGFTDDEMVVEFTNLITYRDGVVHVKHAIRVNETDPAMTLPLFSSSIDNVIILDENQSVLDYNRDGLNLTIFTLGTKIVSLEYDTLSLTNTRPQLFLLINF